MRLEAMLDGGSVCLSASVQGAFALVEVEDYGPGIPDELWANLFSRSRVFGKRNGLGLGLALSRQTLLDLGGDLWAEKTTSPGARILMRLPLARRDRPIGNADGFPNRHSSSLDPDGVTSSLQLIYLSATTPTYKSTYYDDETVFGKKAVSDGTAR